MSIIKQDQPGIVAPPPAGGKKVAVDPFVGVPICIRTAVNSFVLIVQQTMGDKAPPVVKLIAEGLEQIARLGPRDAAEELMMAQMLMTHARSVFLNRAAGAQQDLQWADLYHIAADRAGNTYRRQMETLVKYRQPRKSRKTSITTIRTAHIHAKQILTTPAQTEPSLVQPVRDRAEERAEGDGSPTAENAAADEAGETLAKEQGSEDLPG